MLSRWITLACALVTVVAGGLLAGGRGLPIGRDAAGALEYSSDLHSTGSDDAFLLGLGFGSFAVTAAVALLALRGRVSSRTLARVHAGNVAWLALVAWLVDLDTSLVTAVRLGDGTLVVGAAAAVAPLLVAAAARARLHLGRRDAGGAGFSL